MSRAYGGPVASPPQISKTPGSVPRPRTGPDDQSRAERSSTPATSPTTSAGKPPERLPGMEARGRTRGTVPTPATGVQRATGRPVRRTLWEEGRHPAALVIFAATAAVVAAATVSILLTGQVGIAFDVMLVAACLGAALMVRPQEFFPIGVLPPLLLLGAVVAVAFVDRSAIARADDPLGQAVVSGLAHHGVALAIAYALTLGVLGLRQLALRNHGALRRKAAAKR